MKTGLFSTFLFALLFSSPATGADKGTTVSLDGLKSTTPAEWVSEKPKNRMRFAQFKLPRAKGDATDALLVIFRGFGGSPKANITRWQQQFRPPQGKSLEDISKVTKTKIAGREAHRLDISGVFVDRPFPGSPKVTLRPDYQMAAIQFDGEKNIFHIKLYGPQKTVQKYLNGFNKWMKSFK